MGVAIACRRDGVAAEQTDFDLAQIRSRSRLRLLVVPPVTATRMITLLSLILSVVRRYVCVCRALTSFVQLR